MDFIHNLLNADKTKLIVNAIAIMGFLFSLYNFFQSLIREKKKLNIHIKQISYMHNIIRLNIDFLNISLLPVSIYNVQLVYQRQKIDVLTTPQLVSVSTNSDGTKTKVFFMVLIRLIRCK